jgi:hypothetical protein
LLQSVWQSFNPVGSHDETGFRNHRNSNVDITTHLRIKFVSVQSCRYPRLSDIPIGQGSGQPLCLTVLSSSKLQRMKPKATAAETVAAFRLALCTRRPVCSQLACLVLALSVLVLPLGGAGHERAPILKPLATEFVPLGTSLESPPTGIFDLPSFLAAPRPVLALLLSGARGPNADSNGRLYSVTKLVFCGSCPRDNPNGRSPPSE